MLTTEELSERLATAYDGLRIAIEVDAVANESAIAARAILKAAQHELIAKHADDINQLGKNAEVREVTISHLCKSHVEMAESAEKAARIKRSELTLAQLTVEGIRAQLRCAELAAGTIRDTRI